MRRDSKPRTAALWVAGLVAVMAASAGCGLFASHGTFNPTGSMTTDRVGATATLLTDGRVLVAGGHLASAELYDPKAGTFSLAGSMSIARDGHTATRLSDGRVLVVGGGSDSAGLTSAELYDPQSGRFSVTGSMAAVRMDFTATLLSDGRVLVAGGQDGAKGSLATAELSDPRTGTFSATGSMATPRSSHTATLLSDGRVLLAGGEGMEYVGTPPQCSEPDEHGYEVCSGGGRNRTSVRTATAELYDPKTGTFSALGQMAAARASHTATLLPDGRVLIAGGTGATDTDGLASAELYDPKTGDFSTTGLMASDRVLHTASPLPSGRVLIAGGRAGGISGTDLVSAEVFDPKSGTFSATGSMATDFFGDTATLLSDGRVLVASSSAAELYQEEQ